MNRVQDHNLTNSIYHIMTVKQESSWSYPNWGYSVPIKISSTASQELIGKIRPTASDDSLLFVSTYMLQLPDKTTLENFLLKELKEQKEG